MFTNRSYVKYCKFTKEGKVSVYMGKNKDGTPKNQLFDHVVGKIKDITKGESTFKNEVVHNWQIKLVGDNEEVILTVGLSSGLTRGLFNCLANADLSQPVQLGCYTKNDFIQPSVIQNGNIVRWKYQEIPKGNKIMVGTKEVFNDTPIVEWLDGLKNEILAKINESAGLEPKNAINKDFDNEQEGVEIDDLPF